MENQLVAKLFRTHVKVIYKYLLKMGCNHHDAENIIQDVMCKVIENMYGIAASKISSWLFRVAVNRYYDLCRQRNRSIDLDINSEVFINKLSDDFSCENYVLLSSEDKLCSV